MKFAIGIPTINRADLLDEALNKYAETYPDTRIFIIDNGNQHICSPHPKTEIFVPTENYGVSKSWNYLCERIFRNYEFALILNDDIVLGSDQFEVNKIIQSNKDFIVNPAGWCAFVIPKKTFEQIGGFDVNFGNAYFEDNDYHYRMKLMGMNYCVENILAPLVFRNSQSIAKDNSLNLRFEANKQYYISKWGGEPTKEKFTTPFNK